MTMFITNRKICMLMICMIITIASLFSPVASHAESTKLTVNTEKIDQFMDFAMNQLHIPGASLGIVKGDQTVYLKGYGISGPDKKLVTPQTPFVLGSTSKSITAFSVIQLVEAGQIDLEAPVQRYLPWFQVADPEATKEILVKHLLHQTSGISTLDGQITLTKGNLPLKEHVQRLKNIELTAPIGSVYQYSNLNYDILGAIVQEVSQIPYTQYVSNNIFRPLDMKHSYGSPNEAEKDRLATGYQPVFGFMVPTEQLGHEGTVPSGYLISSAEDMSNYLIAQMNEGQYKGKNLLSKDSVDHMHKPASLMFGDTYYGMGWTVNKNVIAHDGSTENTYSKMVIDGDYGIILLVNAMDFLHIDGYDKMVTGIHGILRGEEPSLADIPSYNQTFWVIDLVVLTVLVLIAWSIYKSFRWNAQSKATLFWISLRALFILLFCLLVPLAILILLPKVTVPWAVILKFLPGLGHALCFISILLLCVGVIQTVLLIRSIGKRMHA